jgi:hypothetical protein
MVEVDKPGLGAVFDEHVGQEFVTKDVAATMATMTDHPVVVHLSTLAGAEGVDGVTRFYTEHFIGQWPDDVAITRVSRTCDPQRVVDEMLMTFTHDRVIDAFLPGVAPTGRVVQLPVVAMSGSSTARSTTSTSTGTRRHYWYRSGCWDATGCRSPAPSKPRNSAPCQRARQCDAGRRQPE